MTRRRRPAPERRTPALEQLREIVRGNVPAHLGSYLRNLAKASVLVGGVAAAGCSSSFPGGDELTAPTCAGSEWAPLAATNLTVEPDYVGAWSNVGFVPMGSPFDERGTRCATASDPEACEAAIQTLSMETFGRYLMTTDADEVAAHQTEEEFLAVLGDIDTPDEALLRVWYAGYAVSCDDLERSGVREVMGGYEVVATQTSGGCGAPVEISRYLFLVETDGTMTELASEVIERREDWGCEGRRPEGLQPVTGEVPTDPVGRWFASMARLEASAVDAFEGVARELEAHGAPARLIDASRIAAQDEVRHHHAMRRLAERYGARPLAADIVEHPVRDLYAIALENAVEGCIRETYGALAAHRQALAAQDPEVAAAMAEIAEDESRHAALSWEIAAWIEPRLSDAERAELALERARAFADLRTEAELSPDPRLVTLAGLPDAETAQTLLTHLADTVFA